MKRYFGAAAAGVSAIVLAVLLSSQSIVHSEPVGQGQRVVVHLTKYSDDLHAAFMALKLANAMQAQDATVTIFLDLEGVRLADKRVPLDVMWGQAHEPLSKYYNDFVKGGGKVTLCPHCAKVAGVAESDLREGAQIPPEEQVAMLLLLADKVLDY